MRERIKAETERLRPETRDEPTFTETVVEILRQIKNEETILAQITGVAWFDRILKGMMPSDMTILAARPSNGKTALTLQILAEASRRNIRSIFFSKEMTQAKLVIRLLQYLSFEVVGRLLRGSKDPELKQAALSVADEAKAISANIHVISEKISGEDFIRREIEKAVTKGATLMAFDYIQLLTGKGRNRNEEVGLISTAIKNILKDTGIPGIVLSQMNRGVEHDNRRPRLSDLRESGNLEQDADNESFLHRQKDNIGEHTMF